MDKAVDRGRVGTGQVQRYARNYIAHGIAAAGDGQAVHLQGGVFGLLQRLGHTQVFGRLLLHKGQRIAVVGQQGKRVRTARGAGHGQFAAVVISRQAFGLGCCRSVKGCDKGVWRGRVHHDGVGRVAIEGQAQGRCRHGGVAGDKALRGLADLRAIQRNSAKVQAHGVAAQDKGVAVAAGAGDRNFVAVAGIDQLGAQALTGLVDGIDHAGGRGGGHGNRRGIGAVQVQIERLAGDGLACAGK